ncbi:hypothetical protein KSC_040570 [Ktedonobacter sp. SOSP1-52]|uniref:DUF998 domain-containing protein n=1 Tax=Ktedonobacter sp. SOSP1-52 TaxID=2778366 RepID=UPI0019162635|nr:DUF998 domain-containing protein [Ktedonobacter sp. SOSP1-52]GHO65165.1 hypothetical protein KSC_040570 [Ktedonobacter sp. SOSP1-52]
METSTQSTGEQSVAIRLLLACGAIGPLLFIVVFLIEGAIRPHYSAWQNVVSSLSQGEGGWIQMANFIVCGALVLGFAIGLRRALRTGRGSTWGPILLGIFGLCLIGAGFFVTDPLLGYPPGASSTPTVHGTLHNLLSLFVFASLIAACFVLARHEAADPAGRGWAWYSVATGILVAVFFVVTDVVALLNGPAGLMQRICIIIGWSWIALLAIRLMSKKVQRA